MPQLSPTLGFSIYLGVLLLFLLLAIALKNTSLPVKPLSPTKKESKGSFLFFY
uniref:ATP synthase subunit 8 n=1 Tax=Ovatella vulcani TaxID=999270 RepID=G8HPA3_9EUPU|nr:ATP synthase F0 subunit 8 [Ovatella vulcani]AEQ93851.1 ATP synthase subunit 8 [Ovatella vulcani]